MFLGRVIGTCVATVKATGLDGVPLLVVQPLDPHGKSQGDALVMADTVGAGPGEVVYWVSSREAALALEVTFVPVDAAIVGIVDQLDMKPAHGSSFTRGGDEGSWGKAPAAGAKGGAS